MHHFMVQLINGQHSLSIDHVFLGILCVTRHQTQHMHLYKYFSVPRRLFCDPRRAWRGKPFPDAGFENRFTNYK